MHKENPTNSGHKSILNESSKWNKLSAIVFFVIALVFAFLSLFSHGAGIFLLPSLGALLVSIVLYRKQ